MAHGGIAGFWWEFHQRHQLFSFAWFWLGISNVIILFCSEHDSKFIITKYTLKMLPFISRSFFSCAVFNMTCAEFISWANLQKKMRSVVEKKNIWSREYWIVTPTTIREIQPNRFFSSFFIGVKNSTRPVAIDLKLLC